MTQNKLTDLNNHLFAELERLGDEGLAGDKLAEEINRADAISNIASNDDGVTQQVQIKSGVASVADVKVPNPVVLAPYRTFLEVAQPESKFIFRMRSGMMSAIFEADGGMWKIEAAARIKQFLEGELKELGLELKVIA